MKTVDKIIFNDKEYNRLYKGSELLFEVKKEWKGLTFTALEPSTIQYVPSTVSTAQYSYDAVNWNSADNVILNLNTDDKVYFKGYITYNQAYSNRAIFKMTGKVDASGSIMSMQNGNPQDKSLEYEYEFCGLFYGCKSLVTAPELIATTLTIHCYQEMFFACESLVTHPELPATTLTDFCYMGMFENCKSLETAPSLPSNILAYRCYMYMFDSCISLIKAPVLPAKMLGKECYIGMFIGCINLNYVKCDAIEYNKSYFSSWLKNVSPNGDFYCKDSSIFSIGDSGIPSGWTIHSEI